MMKFGLDFGTTNTSFAVNRNGEVEVLKLDEAVLDSRVVRSMLYFLRRETTYGSKVTPQQIASQTFKVGDIVYQGEQEICVGQKAVEKYLQENKNRKPGIRRKIYTGRWIAPISSIEVKTDPIPEYFEEVDYGIGRLLQALKSSLKTHFKGTNIFGEFYSVEKLISMFLAEIKTRAEEKVGEKITEVQVGRPVYFSPSPNLDTKAQDRLQEALKMAGFKKIKFEYEPVAAAKQFVSKLGDKKTIFVFDFGGGTLDTAIVQTGERSSVLATDGVYIGGDLLNADIMQAKLGYYFGASATWGDQGLPMPFHIYEALQSWYSIPSLNNPQMINLLDRLEYKNSDILALKRLRYLIETNLGFEIYEAIETAKKELSEKTESRIIFQDGSIDLDVKITREEFERIISLRTKEVEEVVKRTLEKANLEPSKIDLVVRTGGSSLIPVFEKILGDIFGKEKLTLFETFTSIAAGLALGEI